jgi:hypothetical protein
MSLNRTNFGNCLEERIVHSTWHCVVYDEADLDEPNPDELDLVPNQT